MSLSKHKSQSFDVVIPSPVGKLGLRLTERKLSSIHFLADSKAKNPSLEKELKPILAELQAYFANPRHRFKLSLQPQGTEFQKAVWKALQNIPSGETRTYQELAQKLKTSPRAVGNACRRNPLPIFIPCHRVVAKNGLGGFCGKNEGKFMQVKIALLEFEGALHHPDCSC